MNINFNPIVTILTFILVVIISSCKKDKSDPTVTDVDGNIYHTIKIGKQTWMVENLNVTHYNDGTPIDEVVNNAEWAGLSKGAYCDYNNDETNAKTYGKLYNWFAVNTGKLAPKGWHVPDNDDWSELEIYLIKNGYNYDPANIVDNMIAKSLASKTGWITNTEEGTIGADLTKNNKSGFSALPGGYRHTQGFYSMKGLQATFWSSTDHHSDETSIFMMRSEYKSTGKDNDKKNPGLSVRCVKD